MAESSGGAIGGVIGFRRKLMICLRGELRRCEIVSMCFSVVPKLNGKDRVASIEHLCGCAASGTEP